MTTALNQALPKLRKGRSFFHILLFCLGIVFVFWLAFVAFYLTIYEEYVYEKTVRNRGEKVAEQLAMVMAVPLWHNNLQNIEDTINVMTVPSYIKTIAVHVSPEQRIALSKEQNFDIEASGGIVERGVIWFASVLKEYSQIVDEQEFRKDIYFETENIGYVAVTITSEGITFFVYQIYMLFIASTVLGFLVLAVFAYFVGKRFLWHPLWRLQRILGHVQLDNVAVLEKLVLPAEVFSVATELVEAKLLAQERGQALQVQQEKEQTILAQLRTSKGSLQVVQQRLGGYMVNAAFGLIDWHVSTDKFIISTGARKILGYSLASLPDVRNSFIRLIHTEDSDEPVRIFQRATEENSDTTTFEIRMEHASGEFLWISFYGHAHRDAAGEIISWIFCFVDSSNSNKAQGAVRDDRNWYEALINALPVACLCVEDDGSISFWNAAATSLFGKALGTVVGRSITEAVPWLGSYASIVEQMQRQNAEVYRNRIYTTMYDEDRTFTMLCQRVYHHGKVSVSILLEDITVPIRLGVMASDFNDIILPADEVLYNLTEQLAEKTQDLDDSLLSLEQAFDMSHVASIFTAQKAGLSRAGLQEYFTQRQVQENLDEVKNLAKSVRKIGDTFTEFSDKAVYNKVPVTLYSVCDRALQNLLADDYLEMRYKVGQIFIDKDFSPLLPQVICNERLVEKALYAVLKNAIQATGKMQNGREPKVHIYAVVEGSKLRLNVVDNGMGMAPEDLKRVFEPFFSTRKTDEGLGLGLPLARAIIEDRHQGRFLVESSSEGTHVSVWLPAVLSV